MRLLIGSVGRFIASKRYDLLIETLAELKKEANASSIHLVLVGHGIEEQKLRQQTKKLGLETHVHFIHDFPAYSYYPLFDCFALPSVREGLSMALLEAMSCGLPSIVTGPRTNTRLFGMGQMALLLHLITVKNYFRQ